MALSANVLYAKTFLALNQMGKNVVRQSRKNLAEKTTKTTQSGRRLTSKIDNTGELSRSIKASAEKTNLIFQMAEYGLYVDSGRKPGKYAPVTAIRNWIKTKKIKPRDERGRFMEMTPRNMNSLAFLLNRAIFRHGIKATNFFTDPFDAEFKKLDKKIPDAMITDIETYFNR